MRYAATVSQAASSAATTSLSAATVSPASSSGAPAYTIWSVLPGACSFVQCPECPRKLPLDNVHHHLVRKKTFLKPLEDTQVGTLLIRKSWAWSTFNERKKKKLLVIWSTYFHLALCTTQYHPTNYKKKKIDLKLSSFQTREHPSRSQMHRKWVFLLSDFI